MTAVLDTPDKITPLEEVVELATRDGARVLKRILARCLLVTVVFHRWHGQYQIDGASVSLNEEQIKEEQVTAARWKLIPKSWRDKFTGMESSTRLLVHRYSVPFALKGVYIIPLDKAEELFQHLERYKLNLDQVADEFCSEENYQSMVNILRANLTETQFEEVKKVLPTRQQMRKKFGVEWAVAPIGSTNEILEDPSEYIREARAATNKIIGESIQNMLVLPRQELLGQVQNLLNVMGRNDGTKGKGVRNATINNVKMAFEKLKSFSFLADTDLIDKMSIVENELQDLTVKDINSDAAVSRSLTTVLREVANSAKDENKILESFGRFQREIEFD